MTAGWQSFQQLYLFRQQQQAQVAQHRVAQQRLALGHHLAVGLRLTDILDGLNLGSVC